MVKVPDMTYATTHTLERMEAPISATMIPRLARKRGCSIIPMGTLTKPDRDFRHITTARTSTQLTLKV
jgi:hypothetical protein